MKTFLSRVYLKWVPSDLFESFARNRTASQ
jgi:hypothetical protein